MSGTRVVTSRVAVIQEEASADCPHWLPDALDPEPEQCFCLRCGEALPCPCQARMPNLVKELIPHASQTII